jgi:hypothetical protein
MKVDLAKMSIPHLGKLISDAEDELRKKQVKKLRSQPCQCDRYTCFRCQQLNELDRS